MMACRVSESDQTAHPPKKKIRKQLSLERGAKPFASFEIFCHLKNKNAMQFNQGNFSTKHDEAIGYPRQNKLNLT